MSMNGLAALVGWGMILWRLPRVQLGAPQAAYAFATLVCFTLAATFSTPIVAIRVDSVTRLSGAGMVLEYTFAIAATAAWALNCLHLDPSLRRRRWLVRLAPVVFLGLVALWWLFLAEVETVAAENTNGEVLLTTLVHAYAFVSVVSISVPALGHRAEREPALPIRLRLLFILSTQIILAIWLGARVILGPSIVLGLLPRTYSFAFIKVLIGLMILAYVGSLLPPAAFVRLARAVVHMRTVTALRRLRRIERRTANLLGSPQMDLSLDEALRTPEYAVYRTVIAILDRRKALRQAADPAAQQWAWRLDELVQRAPGYGELVQGLQRIGLV